MHRALGAGLAAICGLAEGKAIAASARIRRQAEIYQDGANADRAANDYRQVSMQVNAATKLKIKLAPGGGWAARIHQ